LNSEVTEGTEKLNSEAADATEKLNSEAAEVTEKLNSEAAEATEIIRATSRYRRDLRVRDVPESDRSVPFVAS
jgi:hypothetical protein